MSLSGATPIKLLFGQSDYNNLIRAVSASVQQFQWAFTSESHWSMLRRRPGHHWLTWVGTWLWLLSAGTMEKGDGKREGVEGRMEVGENREWRRKERG